MRKNIVAGNWKMNNNFQETKLLLNELVKYNNDSETEVMVAPTFVSLESATHILKGSAIEVIAQNMHYATSGAYTGEISASMLKSVGVKTVILGHSERRIFFKETDVILTKKVDAALKSNMRVIFCFGEELNDRKTNNQEKIVELQIANALFHLEALAWKNIVLAYEPVWAIGTGETATPKEVQSMHQFIRKTVEKKYDSTIANSVSILYGGSVKPDNANEIFSKPDVDGGLIGGASLKAKDFFDIINAFQNN